MDDQENSQNQPGGNEPTKEQQEAMQRVKDFHDKLESLGLDMNFMFDMMGGVAENFVKKSEQRLSGLIDLKVKTLGDSLAKQVQDVSANLNSQLTPVISFVNQLQQGMGQAQGQQQPMPNNAMVPVGGDIPPGPGLGAGGGGMGGMMGNLANILPILKMLGLIPGGGGDQGGSGGLAQMATLAKSWGDVMRAMMEPVVEMQTTMRQSLLQEMQTYSKTGGSLPWETDNEAPAPRRPVAQLNQRREIVREIPKLDMDEEARKIANKIQFVVKPYNG